jgi:heme/copper-type cytochrome/quinol oxidase subunit 2
MEPKLTRRRQITLLLLGGAAVALYTWAPGHARSRSQVREVNVSANEFAYAPTTIEVQKDDLVKITFQSVDMAHSFTVDSYRIAKRAGAGQSVVFEFRADQTGRFPIYCTLTQDDRCRQMKGELVVR